LADGDSRRRVVMRIKAGLLLLLLACSLAAQDKSRWRRVYTFEDAVVEMEEIKLSFGNYGRVRFRTVYDKPEPLRGKPGVKYKTVVEDMEFKCAEGEYRVMETAYLDKNGKVVQSYKADESEAWKPVKSVMMENLSGAACRMIARKKL
jgi:hypothetical protein